MPRRIMEKFSIAEISAVDEPAQAPATMAIMKSKRVSMGDKPTHQKEKDVPKTAEELQAELTKSATNLSDAQSFSKSLLTLTGSQLDYYKGLTDSEQGAFLELSTEDRDAIISKAARAKEEEDPVVYKSKSGDVFHKSDDPRVIKMAKRDDEREEELAKMRNAAADASFEKRAIVDFAKFKGETDVKTAVVKALSSIKDDDLRKGAFEMLKAAHDTMATVMKEVGGADSENADVDTTDAEAKLEKMAKDLAAKDNISFAKAYDQVLSSDEGGKLYAKSVG